jgi:DNA-binding CsgD family transcriptional regulator
MASFVYSPPRVLFTRAEQDVLRLAATGATDRIIGEHLDIRLTAVKARWRRIQERVWSRNPVVLRAFGDAQISGSRGAQVRNVIVEFVRENPSELTPYSDEQ